MINSQIRKVSVHSCSESKEFITPGLICMKLFVRPSVCLSVCIFGTLINSAVCLHWHLIFKNVQQWQRKGRLEGIEPPQLSTKRGRAPPEIYVCDGHQHLVSSIGTHELSSRARCFVAPTQETVGSLVYSYAKAEASSNLR